MFQVNQKILIHLNHQALFSSKDESKKLKCRLLQFLFGALRVNIGQKDLRNEQIKKNEKKRRWKKEK